MSDTTARPTWPPPPASELPEPLLSHVHACSLALSSFLHLASPRDRELSDRPAWHRTLRAQVREAADPSSTLHRDLADHLRPYAMYSDCDVKRVDSVLRGVVGEMALSQRSWSVDASTPAADRRWLECWSADQPEEDWRALPTATADDLLELRLHMADLDAIEQVLQEAGGARLRTFAEHERGWDGEGVVMDLGRLAAAYPGHDPKSVSRLLGLALTRRHVVGLLDRDDVVALGLEPAGHVCGFDASLVELDHSLACFQQALTGRDDPERRMIEWARHHRVQLGQDEDLMFFVEHLPGLRASLDDPWNVKTGEVTAQIDRIMQLNPRRAPELKQYRYRPALHELFDAWRMPEYFHADLAMSLDNTARQLAQQGLLPELTDSLDEVVNRSHDDDSARLALGDALEGIVVADGPDGCYRSLAVALRDRLRHMRDSGVWPPASSLLESPRCQRTSTFVDDATAVRVREALVDLHEDQVGSFLSGATGSDRLALYADLSEVLGVLGSVIIGDEPAISTFHASTDGVLVTTCAVMVMARRDGEVGVVAAYPEVPLDPVVRATYPALSQFFTTTFHQRSVSSVHDVARLMRELRNPAWTAARDELTLLLHVDDEVELRRIVENCGSYLLPAHTRHWVQCLLWRFDVFDWQPDRDGRP